MQPRPLGFVLTVALCWVTLAAHAQEQQLPDLGDRESAILSPFEESQMGDAFLREMRRTVPRVKDPILKYFVRTNVNVLAEHSDITYKELHPVIIDAKELNAFAAPGGVIGVNLGLFKYAEDVHEYSSVVAHELAHLSQRHFARRMEHVRSLTVAQLLGFLTSAAVIASGATDAGLAGLVGTYSMIEAGALQYSRSQEHEADRIGFNALTAAQFDPFGAARMFERMQQLFPNQDDAFEFFRTHPLTDKRISDLRAQAQEVQSRVTEFKPSDEYNLMRVRALERFVDASAKPLRDPDAIEGDELHHVYQRALIYVDMKEYKQAVESMQQVLERLPNSILATACYAEVLVLAQQPDSAIAVLESALANTPDNAPLSMIYARALNAVENHEEATSVLLRQAKLHSNDVDVWFELAETAGLAKNIIEVHRARAEFFALRGQYSEAIQNLQQAKKKNDGASFRLDASLDQRILELREQAEREDA